MEYDYKLYHYRTNHGSEIDLILQKNIKSKPIAVEIKSAKNPSSSDVKQLKAFKEEYPNANCYVLCRAPYPYKENDIVFLPFCEGIKELFL